MFNNVSFILKIAILCNNVENQCTAGQATRDKMAPADVILDNYG
jgi:hypothetical protein